MSAENPYEAIVVGIPLDDGFVDEKGVGGEDVWKVVLNVGSSDGITSGNIFVLFALGKELRDPISGGSLGHYEIVRGRARVSHVQERMCTVVSDRSVRRFVPGNALAALGAKAEFTTEQAPFSYVEVGDFARLIS